MDTKKLLVSFLAIASILLVTSLVSASDLTSNESVKVDGMYVMGDTNIVSVVAGELVTVKVYFTAAQNDQDVTITAEIEGDKVDAEATTGSFDVENGSRYSKTLSIRVPYELKDQLSDDLNLNIEIDGRDYKTDLDNFATLRVQRPSYNADVKSISTQSTVDAGETFPVDVVLKNIGYNDLDDLYVTVSVPALGIERNGYFGDIVSIECGDCECIENSEDLYGVDIDRKCSEDDVDTVSGRIFLEVPYGAKAGMYTLEVEVSNDDTSSSETTQIEVANDLTSNVIVTSTLKTVAAGEDAEYNILIVNPTDKLKVYRVVTESSESLSTNADSTVIAVPAGSSKTVNVIANADSEGEYSFNVNIFAGEELVEAVTLNAKVEGNKTIGTNNPVVVLTVILAIIFIVLLIVLIVLIGKKPEKTEEFGESYY